MAKYPAAFETLEGVVRLSGELDFTDAGNQPQPTPGSLLPVANAAGATVDTTTYTNPITGVGKIATLVFPADTPMLAVAIAGDAHPRVLLASDPTDGWYLGDGTHDPLNGQLLQVFSNADGSIVTTIADALAIGVADPNYGQKDTIGQAFQITGGAALQSGAGAPAVGGYVGDLYVRTDGGVGSTIYRCTVAGAAGAAVWVGIL